MKTSNWIMVLGIAVAGAAVALTQAQTAPSSQAASTPAAGKEMSPAMQRALAAQKEAAVAGGNTGGGNTVGSGGATTAPTSRNFATSLPARPPGFTRRSTPSLPREYAVLTERSLFKKGRIRSAEQEAADAAANIRPSNPLSSHLLTGIADASAPGGDGVQTAFIENTSSNSVQRLKVGETVAGGKITHITFDSLEFEHDGKKTKVYVGQSLDGRSPSGYTASPSLTQSSTPTTTYPPGSVAERMRLARLAAMGQPVPSAPGTPGAPGSPAGAPTTQFGEHGGESGPVIVPVPVPADPP